MDNFVSRWRELGNEQDLAYIESKKREYELQNYTGDRVFASYVIENAAHKFDATVLLGLAACKATAASMDENKNNTSYFDGCGFFDAMVNISFRGATGQITLDPITGTRISSTAMYKMTNSIRKPINETHIALEQIDSDVFVDGEWTTFVPYIYNGGETEVPSDLPRYTRKTAITLVQFYGSLD